MSKVRLLWRTYYNKGVDCGFHCKLIRLKARGCNLKKFQFYIEYLVVSYVIVIIISIVIAIIVNTFLFFQRLSNTEVMIAVVKNCASVILKLSIALWGTNIVKSTRRLNPKCVVHVASFALVRRRCGLKWFQFPKVFTTV